MSAMTFREQALAAFDHQLPDVIPVHQQDAVAAGTLAAGIAARL